MRKYELNPTFENAEENFDVLYNTNIVNTLLPYPGAFIRDLSCILWGLYTVYDRELVEFRITIPTQLFLRGEGTGLLRQRLLPESVTDGYWRGHRFMSGWGMRGPTEDYA